jgi:hypothetical protein
MPRVGFKPTIPAFERTKTVHALDCEATVIGREPRTARYNCNVLMNLYSIFNKYMWNFSPCLSRQLSEVLSHGPLLRPSCIINLIVNLAEQSQRREGIPFTYEIMSFITMFIETHHYTLL